MSRWQCWFARVACAGIMVGLACRAEGADAPANEAGAAAPQVKAPLDLSYIPATAVGAAVVRPQPVFTGPGADWLPLEVLTAAGMENVGLDPVKIREAVAVITAKKGPRPEFGIILRFTEPYSKSALLAKLAHGATEVEVGGKTILEVSDSASPSFFLPDAKTLLIAPEPMLRQMIAAKEVDSPLTKLLAVTDFSSTATAVLSVDAIHDLVEEALAKLPLPPAFQGFTKLPDQLSGIFFRVDLSGGNITLDLTLRAHDEASAADVEKTVQQGLDMARQMIQANMSRGVPGFADDPVRAAMGRYMSRMTNRSFDKLKPARHGTDVSIREVSEGGVLVVGACAGLLLPAVNSARNAARHVQSANNIHEMGLALLQYEAQYGTFPAHAIFDKQGKPLLSWRVQILPFIDQANLYAQFHLDEPWDSEHNKPLIAMMPAVYDNPTRQKHDGTTTYLVPVGKGLAFEGDKKLRMADFTDGMSNTILLVEANDSEGVPWTKPADLEVDLNRLLRGLGSAQEGGTFNVLFADGSVHSISNTIDQRTLKAVFTRNGGEVIDGSKF
jgi:prepilin-type processing-associated H-X9-DG protein